MHHKDGQELSVPGKTSQKRQYHRPELERFGRLAELTRAAGLTCHDDSGACLVGGTKPDMTMTIMM